jgi:nitroreductase
MQLIEAINQRRSIRSYKPDHVPKETIREILEAGNCAPSAKNSQPWRFTVLTGRSKDDYVSMLRTKIISFIEIHGKEQAGSAPRSVEIMGQAPVVVIIWNADTHGWTTEEHSVAAAIQNICLRAYDLGLGSLWIGDVYYAYEETRRFFDKNWMLSGAVALEYPAYKGNPPKKKPLDELMEFLE